MRTTAPTATAQALANAQGVHDLFERQAARVPDAEALVWRGGSVLYRELNERANRLAHYLVRSGVRRGQRIGVALTRSDELIVGLLAVLKTGACYVPLDPAYPAERIAFMVADSRSAFILGDAAIETVVRSRGLECRCISPTSASVASLPGTNVRPSTHAHDLAYVIYTSGSTGRPKGVAIEHRSTLALIQWAADTFTATEVGGMLASTSICFDLSVFEVFAPLCIGGRIFLVSNALELADVPFRDDVTLLNTVPSAMRALLRMDGLPRSVSTVVLAGEALTRELAREVGAQPGVQRIVNAYGPTEDTTYSTWAEIDPAADDVPPIGRPLPGSYTRVLNDRLQLCAAGETGESFSAVWAWRGDTWANRSSPQSASFAIRSARIPARASIARAIACASARTGSSSTSVGSTTR